MCVCAWMWVLVGFGCWLGLGMLHAYVRAVRVMCVAHSKYSIYCVLPRPPLHQPSPPSPFTFHLSLTAHRISHTPSRDCATRRNYIWYLGKTEASKKIMQYVAAVSGSSKKVNVYVCILARILVPITMTHHYDSSL